MKRILILPAAVIVAAATAAASSAHAQQRYTPPKPAVMKPATPIGAAKPVLIAKPAPGFGAVRPGVGAIGPGFTNGGRLVGNCGGC